MQKAPFGTWISPINAAAVAAGERRLEWASFVGEEVWWTELRPAEAGRSALVRWAPDGSVGDVLGAEWNVRTRVMEYGGRPWLPLGADPTAGFVFTEWVDQRVYRVVPGEEPEPISPEPARPGGARYCDFARVGDEVWCLREESVGPHVADIRRELVAIPLDGSASTDATAVRVLGRSHHFMTGPKVSPDGHHVCWLGWDHPTMPWDGTELVCASVDSEGKLGSVRTVSGGEGVAVQQVEWAPDRPGVLYLLSDPDGWWNLYELDLEGAARPLCSRAEEFGEALWRIGAQWFFPVGGGRLLVTHGTARRQLAVLEADGSLKAIDGGEQYTEWAALATDGRRVMATAGGPRHHRALLLVDPGRDMPVTDVLRAASTRYVQYLSPGRHEIFRSDEGEAVHTFVYPPYNPDFTASDGELPPYVVHVHGGPTTRSQLVADLSIAFFTSRGIGVVDVQYGGSTGFGRRYRERLRGNWGVVDVQDCATAIRGLVGQGAADPRRLGIRGKSAGGWTSAASLIAEPDLYRVAAMYYPLLDPEGWSEGGTHDFESRYLDGLVGPWPQAAERYAQVSPLRGADRVQTPFVLFQGLDDAICLPNHTERFLERVSDKVLYAYITFEGERHGFRRADTLIACLEAELSAYAQAFAFDTPYISTIDLIHGPSADAVGR
ncbi:prolyl oligopeptidase family serine peptidase [Streptomyces sp. NPDC005336]|uniref:prolyl oligopeptidase family serine peptidase n=1 Tax=Streptomyces sp. NPDC005336 TaxID=3157035 RepID=UPI0033B43DF1